MSGIRTAPFDSRKRPLQVTPDERSGIAPIYSSRKIHVLAASEHGPSQPATDPAQSAAPAPASTGSIAVQSTPEGAEVYADNLFIGNAPATLKFASGQHTIRVTLAGYKDWSRDISVQNGSDAHLTGAMEKLP